MAMRSQLPVTAIMINQLPVTAMRNQLPFTAMRNPVTS
jgi:hypothetical protein